MNLVPENSILLQDHLHGALDWILFTDPMCIVQANIADEVEPCLKAIEGYLNKGYYAAGYLAYEASRGLDSSLCTDTGCDYPVLWFGIYRNYRTFDFASIEDKSFHLNHWEPDVTGDAYDRAIEKIREYICRGETYQVNFTFRLRNSFSGDPLSLAKALFEAQASDYCAYINLGRWQIISASPELFFKHASGQVLSRPMKGTVKRGLFDSDDDQRISWLKNSEKNRAENVMIVDMIRNDMGRVADVGSVRVDELFSIERYPTVFQMTSTVSSTTRNSSVDVLRKMFPCASVTGAPKVRTMQIIREVESGPRGIYTGSIGYFLPDSQAQFNVAIRTVVVDSASSTAEYGVGGGIVWDSRASEEFSECKAKAGILTHREPVFQLLESLLWTPAWDFVLLDRHLERIARAARYFNFTYDRQEVIAALLRAVEGQVGAVKVRLVLDKSGGAEGFVEPLSSTVGKTVCLALSGVDTQSAFVYHKTTNRALYTGVLARYPNASDVILLNQKGLVTESCTANVVINTGDSFITPTLRDGLLGGVYREQLLEEGRIAEGHVMPEDLLSAEAIYLINSVRGWMKLSAIEINPVAKQGKWKILEEHLFDPDKLFFRKSNSGPSVCPQ